MSEWPTYQCLCGRRWPCRDVLKAWAGLKWKTHPGEVRPFQEWVRQRMPSQGFSARDIDLLTGPNAGVFEVSSSHINGKKLEAIAAFHDAVGPISIEFSRKDGLHANVPEPVEHYPAPCGSCGLPVQPVVADEIWVNGWLTTVDALKAMLLDPALAADAQPVSAEP